MSKLFGEKELYYYHKVVKVLPDSVIAGGAIRDYINKKEYNDVDIFISTKQEEMKKYGIGYFIDEVFPEVFDFSSEDYIEPIGAGESSSSDNCNHFYGYNVIKDGLKFQFIFLDCSPIDYIRKDFDLNCCKIMYHNGGVYKTPDYKLFEKTKVMDVKYSHNRNYSFFTLVRAKKVILKYPELTFGPNLQNLEKSIVEYEKVKSESKILFDFAKVNGTVGVFVDVDNDIINYSTTTTTTNNS